MSATLGDAYVNIIPKAPGIESKLSSMFDGASDSTGKSSGQSIGKSLLSALGGIVTAAAVGSILKSAFSAGGDIQQSFGGLDTIYGDAANSMKELSQQAAQYGVSANTYAEQAVSFGAALKQAYGGDTVAAAEAANMAIQDMADNSAKLGTDMTLVQNAYSGFAKQNYTMLDNLAIGYQGTKSEMERLLADAQELSGVEYNIDNLGDVYEAIHVIQGELGLTGTAAEEAATTFTGALGSLKASWTNVLASMTSGELDLGTALGNLETSVGNFSTVALGMFTNLSTQLPTILTSISTMITTNAPTLIQSGVTILTNLITGLMQAIPSLILTVPTLIMSFVTAIGANAPMLLQGATQMLQTLATGLQTAIPTLIAAVPTLITGLLEAFLTNGPQLISAGADLILAVAQGLINSIPTLIENIPILIAEIIASLAAADAQLLASGIELILNLATGMIEAIPDLIEQLPEIWESIKESFTGVDWASIGSNIISGIINGISAAASSLFSSLTSLASNALAAAKSALGIASPSKLFKNEVGKWIPEGMAVGIEMNASSVNSAIGDMSASAASEFESAATPGMTATGYTSNTTAQATQTSPTTVTIEFAGSLAQLGRVLQPYIKQEGSRIGAGFVSGGSYA